MEDFRSFDVMPNSVVFSMLGMLRERNLLSFPLSKWPWRSLFRKSTIYGEYWLPFYEAVRRKWTGDNDLISAVTDDPIFGRMISANVTFLEDRVFDASTINIGSSTPQVEFQRSHRR